ncbi:putative RNA-directed DNA polymerase [Dioscorea sansibarensis]
MKCYARLHPRAVNCRKKKCGHSNQSLVETETQEEDQISKGLCCLHGLNFEINFHKFCDSTSRISISLGKLHDGVYVYKALPSTISTISGNNSIELWHKTMGHRASQSLSLVCVAPSSSSKQKAGSGCDVRYRAKQTHDSFPTSNSTTSDCFQLIRCDICGVYQLQSLVSAHYFLTILDNYSCAIWVYLMSEKDEASELLKNFVQ